MTKGLSAGCHFTTGFQHFCSPEWHSYQCDYFYHYYFYRSISNGVAYLQSICLPCQLHHFAKAKLKAIYNASCVSPPFTAHTGQYD